MSVSIYFSAVNQKLLYARQLLITAQKPETNKHLEEALAQSIVLHQEMAWRWHLQDIAATYKLPDIEIIDSAATLQRQLIEQGKAPSEAAELTNLESDSQSWVGELHAAYRQLFMLPSIRKSVMDADRLPLIAVDDEESPIDWNIDQLQFWQQQLEELVERQREMMVEF